MDALVFTSHAPSRNSYASPVTTHFRQNVRNDPISRDDRGRIGWKIRVKAVEALGQLGDVRAVEPLIAALHDHVRWDQASVAKALGELGDRRAVEPLIAALQKHATVRSAAAKALGQLGDARAVEPLIAALQRPRNSYSDHYEEDQAKQSVIDALASFADARAFEPLRDTLLDDNRGTALHAAQALGNFGEPAVEPLIKFLKRCYQYQVATVAEVLVRLKDPRAIEPLSGWITDKTAGPAAVAAIAALGGPAAVVEQLVARLMRTDDMLVNHDLLKALESQGPSIDRSSAPLLVPLLTHWDRDTRKMAADMLALHGWQPADDAQRAAVAVARRNWDEAVRLGSPSVDPLIRGLLGAARHLKGVSEYTAALARIGTPAMDRLIAMLASDNSQERRAAATALGEAGDAR
ncbi:MAG TPA: HEAT repeat domain-containing protein, partial [Ktedonobacterales bacterium]